MEAIVPALSRCGCDDATISLLSWSRWQVNKQSINRAILSCLRLTFPRTRRPGLHSGNRQTRRLISCWSGALTLASWDYQDPSSLCNAMTSRIQGSFLLSLLFRHFIFSPRSLPLHSSSNHSNLSLDIPQSLINLISSLLQLAQPRMTLPLLCLFRPICLLVRLRL